MVGLALLSGEAVHGGSVLGMAVNIHLNYAGAHLQYMLKYFWPESLPRPDTNQCGPEQHEIDFGRRFRINRAQFSIICTAVVASSEYMRQGLRPDATGRIGLTPLLKVI